MIKTGFFEGIVVEKENMWSFFEIFVLKDSISWLSGSYYSKFGGKL